MNEEIELIRSFVIARKRDRLVELLSGSKKRSKAKTSLAHFRDLDPRYILPIPGSEQDPKSIEKLLRSRGAGESCFVVSENSALDARRLPLLEALDLVVGKGMGTLLSCVPGRLAFFEGESPSDRCILERRAI